MFIRYRSDEVCSIIDPKHSGKIAKNVLGFGGEIPIVSTFLEAVDYAPDILVIGSAPLGGRINDEYRNEIIDAIKFGCDIYNGMHQFLNDDPELSRLAKKNSITINDFRCPPDPPHFSKGSWKKRKTKVLLVVGTDCDTGKMTTAWEITDRLKKRGIIVEVVGTGQTGIMLNGWGVPVDAVISDFMAGEIENAIDSIENKVDLVVVEGQGSLTNMYYSGVTLGLMHGAMPDYMIITDEPGRDFDASDYKVANIGDVMDLHLLLMRNFKSSKFLGINLLTLKMPENLAIEKIREIESKYNLPTTDLIRFGDGQLIDAIEKELLLL